VLRRSIPTILFFGLNLTACTTTWTATNGQAITSSSLQPSLAVSAAHDIPCPIEEVVVIPYSYYPAKSLYFAEGCDTRVTYITTFDGALMLIGKVALSAHASPSVHGE
jgi:hypothetical protein